MLNVDMLIPVLATRSRTSAYVSSVKAAQQSGAQRHRQSEGKS